VLDVGCGLGFETAKLAGDDRELFGIDYDPATAATAQRDHPLRAACMDGGRLGFKDGSFDFVSSSHLIEHFVSPDRHAAELARVLKPTGTALIVTPNRPADFENPYHVALLDPADLRALLRRFFADVTVLGLDATPKVKEDFAKRRETGAKVLRLDVFDIRHRIPREWYIAAYTVALRLMYRLLSDKYAGGSTGISADEFFVTDQLDETTLVLLAVAREPIRASDLSGKSADEIGEPESSSARMSDDAPVLPNR
jgi:SAM-dependent methyltransferase